MKIVILAHEVGDKFWPVTSPDYPRALLSLTYNGNPLLIDTIMRCLTLRDMDPKSIFVATTGEATTFIKKNKLLSPLKIPQKNILACPSGSTYDQVLQFLISKLESIPDKEVVAFIPGDQFFWPEEGFSFHASNMISGVEKSWPKDILAMAIQPNLPINNMSYLLGDWKQVGTVGLVYEPPGAPEETRLSTLLLSATDVKENYTLTNEENLLVDGWLWDIKIRVAYMGVFRKAVKSDRDITANLIKQKNLKIAVATKIVWSVLDSWVTMKYLTHSTGLFSLLEDPTVHNIDSESNLIRKFPNKEVILMGVEDLIIIDTPEKLLIATPGAAHEHL